MAELSPKTRSKKFCLFFNYYFKDTTLINSITVFFPLPAKLMKYFWYFVCGIYYILPCTVAVNLICFISLLVYKLYKKGSNVLFIPQDPHNSRPLNKYWICFITLSYILNHYIYGLLASPLFFISLANWYLLFNTQVNFFLLQVFSQHLVV